MKGFLELYSKDGTLFFVQIDHLTGELLGHIIDCFYEAGAKNVQIVNSITKKNRPAYLLFIDGTKADAAKIEQIIVEECGSSGWHRIETCHRHTRVSVLTREIKVRTAKSVYNFTARGKVIDEDVKNIRPEYDDCLKLKELLWEKEGTAFPLRQLQKDLAELLRNEREELIL